MQNSALVSGHSCTLLRLQHSFSLACSFFSSLEPQSVASHLPRGYVPQIGCLSLHQGFLNGLSDSIISRWLRSEQGVFGPGHREGWFVRGLQMLCLSSVSPQKATLLPDLLQFVRGGFCHE